jgi:hypothetical protein
LHVLIFFSPSGPCIFILKGRDRDVITIIVTDLVTTSSRPVV